MTSQTQEETKGMTDQYDALLQAAENGLIFTINNNQPGVPGTGELTITHSEDNTTNVHATETGGDEYRIHRDAENELIYSRVTPTGLKFEDKIITLEILGEK